MNLNIQHNHCENLSDSKLYRIGMFAQMNHMTVKALRFYEEQGLIVPAYVDDENGYRYYTIDQMAIIHQINALKQAGFTLDEIKILHSGVDEDVLLQRKKTQILSAIAELTKQLSVLDSYILDKTSSLASPVLIKTIPEVTIASMKTRIVSYDDLFDCMPEMGAEMEKLGLKCADPEYCFTQYLEPEFKEENILIETCQSISGKIKESDKIKCQTLPETKAACIYHKGSYADFSRSYAAVLKYIEINNYEIAGPIRESYIDGVWNKENEEDWLSEVQIPIK